MLSIEFFIRLKKTLAICSLSHLNKTFLSSEIREIRSQLDRAKELLAQSDKAIEYWEKRIENGFGDLGPGFRDLLKGQKNVDTGGRSSFAKSSGKLKQKKSRGEEE